MSRNRIENSPVHGSIRQCIQDWGICLEDYDDLLKALFLVAPKDPGAHAETKIDSKGAPIVNTFVRRDFDGATIVAEDRGAVYAVWVNKIDEDERTTKVLGFTQIPWGHV